MKKLLATLMILVPVKVYASHWEDVFANKDMAYFIHTPAVKIDGSKVTVGTLANYSQPQDGPNGKKYRSYKALEMFDCANMTVQTVRITLMSGSMGKGLGISTHAAPWHARHRALNEAGKEMWAFVCSKL